MMVHRTSKRIHLKGLMVLLQILLLGVLLSSAVRGEDKTVPRPCPLDADLWILAGQSNMVGAGQLKGKDPVPEDPRILMFDMTNEWMPARDPMHRIFEAVYPAHFNIYISAYEKMNDPQKLKDATTVWEDLKAQSKAGAWAAGLGIGPGRPFARHLIKYTDRPIGLIPCAHGGTSMPQWDPARKDQGDGSLYGAMITRAKMVGGGPKIKGLLWYQGESDALATPEQCAQFEERFLKFIDSLRADLGRPDLPILYVQIGRVVTPDQSSAKRWEEVREMQRRVAQKCKGVCMVTGIDLTLDDVIHVSGEGQERLGRRLAEVALSEVYHKPGHATPIDLASVKVDPKNPALIRLHFSGVSGRLKAAGRPIQFELREPAPAYTYVPFIFRVDFDPEDPAGLILVLSAPVTAPIKLICGAGLDPYLNIVDEKDMPVPAFGPVEVSVKMPAGK